MVSLFCLLLSRFTEQLTGKRGEVVGKAIDLDLDGDGKISEEEWAAAEMGENKQEDEKEWWGEEE